MIHVLMVMACAYYAFVPTSHWNIPSAFMQYFNVMPSCHIDVESRASGGMDTDLYVGEQNISDTVSNKLKSEEVWNLQTAFSRVPLLGKSP